MKKPAVTVLILLAVLFFAGCSEENLGKNAIIKNQYVFKGENELWSAEYRVNGEGRFTGKDGRFEFDSWTDNQLTVFYRHDVSELADITELEIFYQALNRGGSIKMNRLEDGLPDRIFQLHSGGNGSMISGDEPITVTVVTDGQSQSFELTNKTNVQDKLDFLLGKSPLEIRAAMKDWK